MKITYNQNKILHALLNKTGLTEFKRELVYSYSNNRTESSKELLIDEATALINYLKKQNPETVQAEKMRRKIIAMAHKMRWETEEGKVNMKSVNNWCINKSYLKKPLMEYSLQELPKLVSQFENVYKSITAKI